MNGEILEPYYKYWGKALASATYWTIRGCTECDSYEGCTDEGGEPDPTGCSAVDGDAIASSILAALASQFPNLAASAHEPSRWYILAAVLPLCVAGRAIPPCLALTPRATFYVPGQSPPIGVT